MQKSFSTLLKGYERFRKKYASGDQSVMQFLSEYGQQPQTMVVACCDSRVDPALILQCDPGDLFVVRNVANIVPPYERDRYPGTSAALEFGIRFLHVKHLILLGHSQCGGIQALLQGDDKNDFIKSWVSLIETPGVKPSQVDECAKLALHQSHKNCMTFPWIVEKVNGNELIIHQWFFDIKHGQIFNFHQDINTYLPLDQDVEPS